MSSKNIPRFNNASEQSREIGGLTCSVCRLSAGEFFPFLSRLLADVGPLVARIISTPDDELDPGIEALIMSVMPQGTGIASGKLAVILQALENVGNIDIGWYGKTLLPGKLKIDGVAIDTMAELDATGIGMTQLLEVLALAFIVNVGPTSAGLTMSSGSGDRRQVTASQPTATSNLRGAKPQAGPLDPTSQTAGQYFA